MTPSEPRSGLLFVLAGPTGAGKNTLMRRALAALPDLAQLPTATTRPPRADEREGREHFFVTLEQFRDMVASRALVEHQEVHPGTWYGVPKAAVHDVMNGQDDRIADVDVLGATYLRARFPDNVVLIFVQPGDTEQVEDSIRQNLEVRGETETEIERRIARVGLEMSYAPYFDYLIVNHRHKLDDAVQQLLAIITAERCRRALANVRVAHGLPRRRMAQVSSVLVLHNDQWLCGEDAFAPTRLIVNGELPHDAAAAALAEVLPTGQQRAPLPLIAITPMPQQEGFVQLTFWHMHRLAQLQPAPAGWHWAPLSSADLPSEVIEALRQGRHWPVAEALS